MDQNTEKQKISIRKLRLWYSIAVPVLLLIAAICYGLYLASTMPERSLMMQLQRAKNLEQLEQILNESNVKLDEDRIAEVYINCALAAFTDKDYDESIKLLRKVVQSKAHPELRCSAQLELANSCFLAGYYQEGVQQIDALLKDPEAPPEFKEKARKMLQFVKTEMRQ